MREYTKYYKLSLWEKIKLKWYLWRKKKKSILSLLGRKIKDRENYSHYLRIKNGRCKIYCTEDHIVVELKYEVNGNAIIRFVFEKKLSFLGVF